MLEEDIIGQLVVQYGFDDCNFLVYFGNIGINEYCIIYKIKIDYFFEKGEIFINYVKLIEN